MDGKYFLLFVLVIKSLNGLSSSSEIKILPSGTILRASGASAVLKCILASDGQENSLKWTGPDGQQIGSYCGQKQYTEERGPFELNLFTVGLGAHQAGVYTCSGLIKEEQVEAETEIQLYKSIEFEYAPRQQSVFQQEEVLVQCRVSGMPAPSVSWRYKGRRIVTGERYFQTCDGLRIKDGTPEDNGMYSCVAEVFEMGIIDTRDIELKVYDGPQLE